MTDYPSPREALFGNGEVANLRCGVKWVLWQFAYLTVAIGLLIDAGVRKTYHGVLVPWGVALDEVFGPYARRVLAVIERVPLGTALIALGWWVEQTTIAIGRGARRRIIAACQRIDAGVMWLVDGRTGRAAYALSFPVAAFVVVVLIALGEIENRTGVFTGFASVVLFGIAAVSDLFRGWFTQSKVCTSEGAKRFAEGTRRKAKEMQERPGTRRIYGYCPVSFDIEPRWFESIAGDSSDA